MPTPSFWGGNARCAGSPGDGFIFAFCIGVKVSPMNERDFISELEESPNFEWRFEQHEGADGIMVANKRFETVTHFTPEKVSTMGLFDLLKQTHHGKNVEQITRVTGFFSKASGWNKGKRGELKDRYRSDIKPVEPVPMMAPVPEIGRVIETPEIAVS